MDSEKSISKFSDSIKLKEKIPKNKRSSYAPLFSGDSMEEIKSYLDFQRLRKRSQRNGYIYYTCKIQGCKKMMRIKQLSNIIIVAWNGKDHNCNDTIKRRSIPISIKSIIKKRFLEGVKPKDINHLLKIEDPLISIEVKQIRNFCYQLKKKNKAF